MNPATARAKPPNSMATAERSWMFSFVALLMIVGILGLMGLIGRIRREACKPYWALLSLSKPLGLRNV